MSLKHKSCEVLSRSCGGMLMRLLKIIILVLLFGRGSFQATAEEVCTAEGCHQLASSVGMSSEEVNSLLSALSLSDGRLTRELSRELGVQNISPQEILDRHCLMEVSINSESRVKVDSGLARPVLQKGVWNTYLIKVVNLAGVTAPLRAFSTEASKSSNDDTQSNSEEDWFQMKLDNSAPLPPRLTGRPLEYRIISLKTECEGKRTAVIAMDVGQGTADIGFRNDVMLTFQCHGQSNGSPPAKNVQSIAYSVDSTFGTDARLPSSDVDLKYWLENMVWYHQYTLDEIGQATGLSASAITEALNRYQISASTKPQRVDDSLILLPYPGGRHPRIGFLDGAISPQRETKASVFLPWDDSSYVVVDVPEAIWSNLGLTYLAHQHIPTLWDKQNIVLRKLEWQKCEDGSLECERRLPNKIEFGTRLTPTTAAIHMEMWLKNGTTETLTDLRIQNCVLLKSASEFQHQTNENKVFWGPYAACRNPEGNRWVITAWEPVQRAWGNPDCPCLHSDPQFPDCAPGETQRIKGLLTFYEGTNIYRELVRLERQGWRQQQSENIDSIKVQGIVLDTSTGDPLPARVHIQDEAGEWFLADSVGGSAVHYVRDKAHLPRSPEVHTTLSSDPFMTHLAPGRYTVRVERGKEYIPLIQQIDVIDQPLQLELPLRRWINMADRGWYSGDTHVHRSIEDLPNVMLAEDLNVALPLTYWVTKSGLSPLVANGEADTSAQGLIEVDATHAIYTTNTEYEIFSVGEHSHTLGAVFVLNHEKPFSIGVPPVAPVAKLARKQGALLDLDKHSWPWSFMIVPIMGVDLFELSNNHIWQAPFGFKDWTLSSTFQEMDIERDEEGFTEWGWINYGFQTYYTLVNCGFRMRVSAGTASGVHPVQLGFGRVYIHLPNGFSYDDWITGLNSGRSFVSTGPMLEVTFNGHDPGHTFKSTLDETHHVQVEGTAQSAHPLDRIEIVVNGQVKEVIEPSNELLPSGGYESSIDTIVDSDESYWVAVRCFEKHPEKRIRFAHTNPIYVDIANHPLRPRKSEVSFLVQRMEEELESNREVLSSEALDEYRHALSIYQEIATNAQ